MGLEQLSDVVEDFFANLILFKNDKFKAFLHRLGGQYIQSVMNNFESGVACMLKKKDEEIANANTTVTTLKNHVFKLKTENFLWKKVAKDTGADVRTLNGELERVKREFAAADDTDTCALVETAIGPINSARKDWILIDYLSWVSQNDKFKAFLHRLGGQYIQSVMNNFESGVACMLKKKDEEIANANTTVTTLKNHVFKLKTENFLWKKVAKDTGADVRTLNGELERVKREFAAASDMDMVDGAVNVAGVVGLLRSMDQRTSSIGRWTGRTSQAGDGSH
ncbi:hypothetical protein QJS10_CPA08g00044 [Acorus calamus]|uniref:Uncharacterized protein n=1 Tax=Acorus calamus TaxID=4465 RepID=A0AAV9EBC5_ACOCL|nr:hypothetical protein QJS10_CPA08g00044 [Acorus calamus]